MKGSLFHLGFIMTLTTFQFLAFIVSSSSSSSSSSSNSFIECLEKYQYSNNPSNPISSSVIYTQNHSSYSSLLQTYIRNLRFNTSATPKPRLILTPKHVSHIQAAVLCAKSHSLQMKIRSGGHDYEGLSYVSFDTPHHHFFILDMFNFRSVHVSIQHESAWVQAGAILGEVYYKIANKSKTHAFPAGVCPTVGVGGHFGGGGYGNLMRKYGLSIDNIVDAKLVNVNGKLLDRKSMGEDLFWAITGGGGSSYGVVLSYKIKLVRVPEKVTVFRISRRYSENFADLIYSYQRIVAELPKELFIRLTLDVVNNTNRATFYALFLGNSKELVSSTMKLNFPELGLTRIHCFEMSWIESVLFWTNFPIGTPVEVLLSRVPQVLTHLKRKSDFVRDPIPKEGLEFIFEKMVELKTPMLTFNPYGGRMGEIPMWEKPFPHRQGNIAKLQYATNWDEDGEEAENYYLNLTRLLYYYMTPAVYLDIGNYQDMIKSANYYFNLTMINVDVRAVNYGVKYFKDNFYRLVKIKTRVDPDNFFRNEQSIPVLFPTKKELVKIKTKVDPHKYTMVVLYTISGTKRTAGASFKALFLGDSNKLISLMKMNFPELGLRKEDCKEMSWIKSVLVWEGFQNAFKMKSVSAFKMKSDYVKTPISKDGIERILQKTKDSANISMMFNPYGGKMSEIPESEIAFPHRAGNIYKIQYLLYWNEMGAVSDNSNP
ncbi:hypothetical protein ACJIZ3_013421 [Penstemon smallii]|uniref:FAD-binding PCMH-type domain-containing protein n=1 Tax=Penstemon smallii TaxID=265156 RepID=A0ABD3UPS4_9LAMI